MRIFLMGAAGLLAACGPGAPDDAALMANETDTLRCHTTESVYTNHTGNQRDLHVRLANNCMPTDTIRMPPAHIRVLQQGGAVAQDVTVDYGKTHRGTFTVPPGGSLELVCPEGFSLEAGCPWTYSY